MSPQLIKSNLISFFGMLTLLIFNSYVVKAQQFDKSYIPNILKAIEPTTAKIHSYNALPVNNYTGKPDIRLSIYDIKLSDKFSMPLELAYDCHFKVDDIPSRNGLGWIINMIGSVTRNVRDLNDFVNLEYYTGPQGDYDLGVFNVSHLGWLETPAIHISGVDYEDALPDEYIVSAPGLSTRFVIKKDFSALELTNQKNKIEVLIDTITIEPFYFRGYTISGTRKRAKKVSITTPYGIKYTFQLVEVLMRTSNSRQACQGLTMYSFDTDIGSIYLTDIEDLSTKRKLSFEYDIFNIFDYSKSVIENYMGDITAENWIGSNNPLIPCLKTDSLIVHYVKNYRVKKIISPGAECSFQYNLQRQDLPGDYCLTGIEVKNADGKIIKKNNFSYSYFNSLENCTQPECKRLKLDSMLECGNNGNCLPYKFTYNELYQLPKRSSHLTDFLGYYNGPQDASVTRPKIYIYPNGYEKTYMPFNLPSSPASIVLPGRSMDVNEAYLKTNVLTKIEYPTGGYIGFEFEANDFKYNNDIIKGGGLRIMKQTLNYGNTQRELIYQYTISKNSTVSSGTMHSLPQFGIPATPLQNTSYSAFYNQSLITRNAQNSIDAINGGYVGYKKVFVIENNNGYTEYSYLNEDDYSIVTPGRVNNVEVPGDDNPYLISNSGYPFIESNFENQSRFGQLKEEVQVTANGTEIQRKKHFYNYLVLDSIPATYTAIYHTSPAHYSYIRNSIGKAMVIRKVSFLPFRDSTFYYANNNTLVEATTRTYRNNNFLPWQTYAVQSDGKTSATWATRVTDTVFQDGAKENLRLSLLSQNRLTEEILNVRSKENKATLSSIDYQLFGDIVRFQQLNSRISDELSYTNEFRIEEYDNRGNPTKVWSRQDNISCLIWDTAGLQVIAIVKGDNISTNKIAYTSFEGNNYGGWTIGTGSTNFITDNPVTGKKVLSGSISKAVPIGNYVIGVWSYANTWVNGQLLTQAPSKIIGPWRYFQVKLTNVSNIEVAGDSIDEVRLCPQGAQMITYTHIPLVGITSQCDINNRITYYEYDNFNRLMLLRDQDKNIIKKICYNYAGQPENCNIYYNTTQNGSFTRNNCGSNYIGSAVTFSIPANIFTSVVSQAEANQQAINEVNAKGQAYANQHGSCTYVYQSNSYSGNYYPQNCPSGQIPQAIYVNVPAGSYTSTISQQHANDQALQYAQNYANQYGTCIANINISCNNNSSGGPLYLIFTNISTNEQFFFESFDNTNGIIGSVPAGGYSLEIVDNYGFYTRTYNVCGNYAYGPSAYYYPITINSSCNTITIY